MKKHRILFLCQDSLVPPPDAAERDPANAPWAAEYDVITALGQLGHDVRVLGMSGDVGVVRTAVEEHKPEVVFNMVEEIHGVALYEPYVVSFVELLRVPYTGCNPRGLMLCHDKALTKKILTYHRIRVPDFAVFPKGKRVRRPKRLQFPLLVKSVSDDASLGIAQSSVVTTDAKLEERVAFIHEQLGRDALVEEYVDGRELYVGLMGHQRILAFPIWELCFDKLPEGVPRIATARVKWNRDYQKRYGIDTRAAADLPAPLQASIFKLCRRAYRALDLSGYARIDMRVSAAGEVFVLEANPNPQLTKDGDFAASAAAAGIDYPHLLQRIVELGLTYEAGWRDA